MNKWKEMWIALKYLLDYRPYPMEYPDVIDEYFGVTWFDNDGNITKERVTWLGKFVKILPARKHNFTHEFVKNENGEEIIQVIHSRSWR